MPDVGPLSTYDPRSAGPYRLTGRLGAGGQGVVFLGLDDRDQQVAVKMINVDLRQNPQAKAQLVREIAAAKRVASFCTAQVLDADLDAEPPYVVSEFIEGPTLQRRVRDLGPLTGNALHRLAVGTAAALAAIHLADVVHCDLKPDNVILGSDGPRVIDFGIARALDSTETATSRIMGTAPYMAPERFRGDPIAPAADIFAWAATIAFAAAGTPPFGTGQPLAVMQRVVNEPPQLSGLSGTLADLVVRCLHKEPPRRPGAQELLLSLLGVTGSPETTPATIDTLVKDTVTVVTPTPPQRDQAARPVPQQQVPRQQVPPPQVPRQQVPPPQAPRQQVPPPQVPRQQVPPQQVPQQQVPPPQVPPPAPRWRDRAARQAGDAWGISAAIFLGAVGAAAGYLASTTAGPAAAVGATTFVVVYGVRLVLATAMGDAETDATGSKSDPADGHGARAHDHGRPTHHHS